MTQFQQADRIVVVGETGIVEEGPHETLLESGGASGRLYAAQFASARHAVQT